MIFKPLVQSILDHTRDPDDITAFNAQNVLIRELSHDLNEAFAISQPLVERYSTAFWESRSYFDFLIKLSHLPLHPSPYDRRLDANTPRPPTFNVTENLQSSHASPCDSNPRRVAQLEEKNKQLQQTLKDTVSKLDNLNKLLQQKINFAENEIRHLTASLCDRNRQLDALEETNKQLLQKLKDTVSNFQQKFDLAEIEIQDLKSSHCRVQQENDTLKQTLSRPPTHPPPTKTPHRDPLPSTAFELETKLSALQKKFNDLNQQWCTDKATCKTLHTINQNLLDSKNELESKLIKQHALFTERLQQCQAELAHCRQVTTYLEQFREAVLQSNSDLVQWLRRTRTENTLLKLNVEQLVHFYKDFMRANREFCEKAQSEESSCEYVVEMVEDDIPSLQWPEASLLPEDGPLLDVVKTHLQLEPTQKESWIERTREHFDRHALYRETLSQIAQGAHVALDDSTLTRHLTQDADVVEEEAWHRQMVERFHSLEALAKSLLGSQPLSQLPDVLKTIQSHSKPIVPHQPVDWLFQYIATLEDQLSEHMRQTRAWGNLYQQWLKQLNVEASTPKETFLDTLVRQTAAPSRKKSDWSSVEMQNLFSALYKQFFALKWDCLRNRLPTDVELRETVRRKIQLLDAISPVERHSALIQVYKQYVDYDLALFAMEPDTFQSITSIDVLLQQCMNETLQHLLQKDG